MKLGEKDILVGHRYHTAGSEPYFVHLHKTTWGLNGRCVVSEEIARGQRYITGVHAVM